MFIAAQLHLDRVVKGIMYPPPKKLLQHTVINQSQTQIGMPPPTMFIRICSRKWWWAWLSHPQQRNNLHLYTIIIHWANTNLSGSLGCWHYRNDLQSSYREHEYCKLGTSVWTVYISDNLDKYFIINIYTSKREITSIIIHLTCLSKPSRLLLFESQG